MIRPRLIAKIALWVSALGAPESDRENPSQPTSLDLASLSTFTELVKHSSLYVYYWTHHGCYRTRRSSFLRWTECNRWIDHIQECRLQTVQSKEEAHRPTIKSCTCRSIGNQSNLAKSVKKRDMPVLVVPIADHVSLIDHLNLVNTVGIENQPVCID